MLFLKRTIYIYISSRLSIGMQNRWTHYVWRFIHVCSCNAVHIISNHTNNVSLHQRFYVSLGILNENQGLLDMKMRQITWQQISHVVIEDYPNLMTEFHFNQSRTEWPASYYNFYVPWVRNHFVWRKQTRLIHNKPSASVPCTSVPD